jgi:hypothetical protein
MKNITVSRDKVEQWLEDLEFSDSDKNVIADIKQALAAQPAPTVQEPVVMPENWFSGMPEEYRKEAWRVATPPAAQPAVPDAITDDSESPEYRAGWNDCRQAMMEMMK